MPLPDGWYKAGVLAGLARYHRAEGIEYRDGISAYKADRYAFSSSPQYRPPREYR